MTPSWVLEGDADSRLEVRDDADLGAGCRLCDVFDGDVDARLEKLRLVGKS